jgi:hypothetical protein
MIVGALGLLASILWWFVFYSYVNISVRGSAIDFVRLLQCLISSTGRCQVANVAGSAWGIPAYEPMVFWISSIFFIVGAVIRKSAAAK